MTKFKRQEINEMLEQACCKLREAELIATKLKTNRYKFIVSNLLDFYCSCISPRVIAEFKNLKDKGII